MKLTAKQLKSLIKETIGEVHDDEVFTAVENLVHVVANNLVGDFNNMDPSAAELGSDAWDGQSVAFQSELEAEINSLINRLVGKFHNGGYYRG